MMGFGSLHHWEFTPLALFTMLPLLKRLTLLALTLCMNTIFYFDCWGHQEFKNIAHNGLWELYAVSTGWNGMDKTPETGTTTRAPALLKIL